MACVRGLLSGLRDEENASLQEVDTLWEEPAAQGVFSLGEILESVLVNGVIIILTGC